VGGVDTMLLETLAKAF